MQKKLDKYHNGGGCVIMIYVMIYVVNGEVIIFLKEDIPNKLKKHKKHNFLKDIQGFFIELNFRNQNNFRR